MREFQNSVVQAVNDLAEHVYETARVSGWHDEPVPVPVSVANIHGEASELWESFRKNTLHEPCDKSEKMSASGIKPLTCLEEELADLLIRVLDTAREHKVDIGEAVRRKDAYNQTRSFRHGSRVA